jgi:Flp pilus assembly protein TadG
MNRGARAFVQLVRDERSGAVAVLVALALPALIGFGALVVDLGYLFAAQIALQAATNAAALAGAQGIGTGGTPITTATNYSAVAGDKNALSGLNVAMASGFPKLLCLSNWAASSGVACTANQTPATSANAIEVQQTASVPVFFAALWGFQPWSISATAVAGHNGGVPQPLNVAFVLDTTASMGQSPVGGAKNPCNNFPTAIACALSGFQTLLGELSPCLPGQTCTNGTATPEDEVALFVFPPVTNATEAALDYACSGAPDIPKPWPAAPPWVQPGQASGGYSGVVNSAGSATKTSTLSLAATMANNPVWPQDTPFNTGTWALVTDLGTPTNAATATTSRNPNVLTFPAGVVTAKMTAGLTIQDTTNPGAISAGTTVASISAANSTVTMSASVAGSGVASGDLITFGTAIPPGAGGNPWPWWQNTSPTTISSVTPPTTATMSAGPNASPNGAGIVQGDTIIVAPLYQITGFLADYRTSDTAAALNFDSDISKAVGAGPKGCPPVQTPGGLNTFYGDAITAAQTALVAEQAARIAAGQSGGTNVIILLTDGNANADAEKMGPLKTASNECLAAVSAAQNAAAAGTWVYAVYYDDNVNGTCTTDTGNYTGPDPDGACYTLQQIANVPGATPGTSVNDPTKFYSTDVSGTCKSVNSYTSIADIFTSIGASLTRGRLIPAACLNQANTC